MKSFRYNTQTCVYFGRNCLEEKGEVLKDYGKKAVVVTSIFLCGRENHGLNDLKSLLDKQKIEYIVLDQTEENPSIDNILGMYEKIKDFDADYVVGVGGGSALDAAKAVAMLIDNPGKDVYEVFYGPGKPINNFKTANRTPVFTIPTTAGTGSEVTGGAVITRPDKDTKEAMYMWVFPEISFVDSRYIEESPQRLLDTGAIDALAHGIECCLHRDNNLLNRGIANVGFGLFRDFKDNLLNKTMSEEDFEKMHLAAFIQGIAFMQSSTTIPHGLGYPLSHFKHVCHGLACGIFLGEYLRGFKDQSKIQPLIEAIGFANVDDFADYVRELTNRDVDIEVTEEELHKWAADFMVQQQWRLEVNPEKLTEDDIYNLFRKSLAAYVK